MNLLSRSQPTWNPQPKGSPQHELLKGRRLTCLALSFIFLLLLVAVRPGLAQDEITVSADRMFRDSEKQMVTLEGNIQVVFKGNHLSAKKAQIYQKEKRIEASGNVILQNSKVYAEAEKITFNYDQDTGTFEDAFVQSGQVIFEGRLIKKVGENEYVAIDGEYTACNTCPPAWSFSGKEIEAEFGGYAFIKYPVLKVGGYSIFFLPRLLIPLKSERQSGFLVPSADWSGSGGLAIAQSYFWAIARNQDLTLTAKRYSKRGWKGLFDYRYVTSPTSSGQLQGGFIPDKAFKQDGEIHQLDRGFMKYQHYFDMPNNITHRASLNYISDLRYLRDFPDEVAYPGDSALENRVSLTHNRERQHYSAELSYYQNLLEADPRADNEAAVHRFPELRYSLIPQKVGESPFMFDLNLNYVNFARNTFGYDDYQDQGTIGERDEADEFTKERDGSFDPPLDLIRTGHRLDFQPTVSWPVHFGSLFSILPSVTYRETQYRFNPIYDPPPSPEPINYSRSAARRYLRTDLSIKTSLSRVFGQSDVDRAVLYKHEIEPEIYYSTIPWARRPDHVFFGNFEDQPFSRNSEPITDNDLFNPNSLLQFDYHDRLYDKNLITFSLTNRIIRKTWVGDSAVYQKIASLHLIQSYDFNEAKRSTPQPWSKIGATLNLRLDQFETYTTAIYYPYAPVTNTSSRVKMLNTKGDFVEFSYSRFVIVDEQSNYDPAKRTENLGMGLGWAFRYFNLAGQITFSSTAEHEDYRMLNWGYVAAFEPPGDCWKLVIDHKQVINRPDPTIKLNFEMRFGGEDT